MPAMKTRDSYTHVLALATLGGVTEIEMILITKESKECNAASQYCRHFSNTNLAHVNEPIWNSLAYFSMPTIYARRRLTIQTNHHNDTQHNDT